MISKAIWQRVAKTAVLYAVFVIAGVICMFTLRTDIVQLRSFWNQRLYGSVSFFYMLLILFSLLGIFLVHDFPYRDKMIAKTKASAYGDVERSAVRVLLSSYELWTDAASLCIFTVILPAGAYYEFKTAFLGRIAEGWQLVIFLAVMIPAEILITLAAHLSTLSWWARPKVRRYEESRIKQVTDWIGQTLFSAILYVVGAYALIFVVPVIYTAFLTAWVFATTLTVAAVILVIYLICGKYVRVLICRRHFMKKLRRICKKNGARIKDEKRIYACVLSAKKGSNFTVEVGDTDYICRFVTPLKKKVPVYFSENGEVNFIRRVYIADHYRTEDYFFDAPEGKKSKKLLVVNPGAMRLYATDEIHHRELHSGDKVMGYEIYRSDNFLSAVKRQYFGK